MESLEGGVTGQEHNYSYMFNFEQVSPLWSIHDLSSMKIQLNLDKLTKL